MRTEGNRPSPSSSSSSANFILAFVAGVATHAVLVTILRKYPKKNDNHDNPTQSRENAGATIEGNDLSLFYGHVSELTKITDQRKFLPSEVYGTMVRDAVVCCVDCLIVRQIETVDEKTRKTQTRKECLLVLRSTEPVKGVWWLPGGRLLKGETFFAAAQRKAQEETGLTDVTPIQVLGVWNTFFPTSHWDTETSRGTQTVNPIVLVELNKANVDVKLDETSEQWRWIGLDPDEAAKNGEDPYVLQALLRLQAWNPKYNS